MSEYILYMKDNTGAIREWAISACEQLITIRYGQHRGAMQYQTEFVAEGKQSRSVEEQVYDRMSSRISKQEDKGYTKDFQTACDRPQALNALGFIKPMLAQPIARVKNIDYTDAVAQPKFDGNRCMIYCEDGINKAYTRNGKQLENIEHILNDIILDEGMVVDGELYCHGYPLQTIVSWIKRKQENTALLKYHLYDVASYLPYKGRSDIIRGIPIGESISPVYGDPMGCYGDVLDAFRDYRDQGYEGAILRWGNSGYEDGKRSKSLVKIKEWHDDEFVVINIHESADGWAILECHVGPEKTLRVSAPGSIDEKINILENRDDYIGRLVTVEYANLTADGIPFHPVALQFRDEIQ